MNEIIFMVHEPPEGGYAAETLGHSIFTFGDTLEELREMVRNAVVCHFEEGIRPKIIRGCRFVGCHRGMKPLGSPSGAQR